MPARTLYPRFAARWLAEALADSPAVLIHGPPQSGKTMLARMAGKRAGFAYFTSMTRPRSPRRRAIRWVSSPAWRVAHGPDIAPDMPVAERCDDGELVPAQRLLAAFVSALRPGALRMKGGEGCIEWAL